jgi:hypothetical protein
MHTPTDQASKPLATAGSKCNRDPAPAGVAPESRMTGPTEIRNARWLTSR